MARTTSIAKLKASLSEILAGVKAGEEVIVTDRGTAVARIVPCDRTTAGIDSLVRAGVARPARRALPKDFLRRPRPKDPGGRALAALLEDREDDR